MQWSAFIFGAFSGVGACFALFCVATMLRRNEDAIDYVRDWYAAAARRRMSMLKELMKDPHCSIPEVYRTSSTLLIFDLQPVMPFSSMDQAEARKAAQDLMVSIWRIFHGRGVTLSPAMQVRIQAEMAKDRVENPDTTATEKLNNV